MDEMYFRISHIQKKMDSNKNLQTIMKVISALIVFVIFSSSISRPNAMRVAWMLSIPLIIVLFSFDVYYIKMNKKCEFEIYRLEVDTLERKKRVAEIRDEFLPDAVLNRKIQEPESEIELPFLYYAIMLILDILIRIIMIH